MQQVASQNTPSPAIVIPHFIFGGFVWLFVTVLLFLFPETLIGHYFNPKLLAITHLLVLGFISMVIFGALYQLIPVIMEVKLYSERLAVLSFIFLAIGTLWLAISFWNFWLGTSMHIAATWVLLAVSLFVVNVFATGRTTQKKSIQNDFIQTAVVWLLFTIVAGIALAINLTYPFLNTPHLELLKLHAHAGIVGWFIQLIMGVGSKLLPMFMVSHQLNAKKLQAAYYLVNIGLVVAMASIFLQFQYGIWASVITVAIGILAFLSYLREAYDKRVKKWLDVGMKKSAFSFLILTIPIGLILLLVFGSAQVDEHISPLATAYGFALLIGFVSALIMGQTYKTLPFIVWLNVYRKKIGKGKTPFPKDLYSEKAATIQLWAFAFGFVLLLGGIVFQKEIVLQLGALALVASVLFYNFNILKIVLHKTK
ncbi:MAG: hypothetical protein KDC83_13225 [Flavobacteriales bacterium]|nr:hypothetical protein [Flavobacteriales bacterium]